GVLAGSGRGTGAQQCPGHLPPFTRLDRRPGSGVLHEGPVPTAGGRRRAAGPGGDRGAGGGHHVEASADARRRGGGRGVPGLGPGWRRDRNGRQPDRRGNRGLTTPPNTTRRTSMNGDREVAVGCGSLDYLAVVVGSPRSWWVVRSAPMPV